MAQAQQDPDGVIGNVDNLKHLDLALKCNIAVCTSAGQYFTSQLDRIFVDMLALYKVVSGIISSTSATDGLYILVLFACITDHKQVQYRIAHRRSANCAP